ncbi:MAG TPA: hypothetical protein VFA36_02955 [Burkholderiales bacterium]|jgi:hypothetical protein|nr:hypothetical protein [Burkholderiales bacterium]
MRILLLLALAAATPTWAQQKARPLEGMSDAQRADYRRLMRGYLDAFRILGRSKICGLNFDAEPFFRELARRHGDKSEPVRIAGISYAAGAENLMVSRDVDPAPPAPMPCDVVALMRDMRLPELPASLVQREE